MGGTAAQFLIEIDLHQGIAYKLLPPKSSVDITVIVIKISNVRFCLIRNAIVIIYSGLQEYVHNCKRQLGIIRTFLDLIKVSVSYDYYFF